MHLPRLLSSAFLCASLVSARRSWRHVGRQDPQFPAAHIDPRSYGQAYTFSKRADPLFLNSNTSSFVVNGTGIPDVDFDVGESYAGYLPISSEPNDENKLFWWFFPSTNPAASKEILIWLNGGPGCSSFEGLLQENGPFLWQYGTLKPVANPWAWNRLTNVVWVEQPVGTGFSTGKITATSEEDIAKQFMGFWKNFVNTFSMQGYKVYIAGESYAGLFCPYIASAMLDAKDPTYFNVSGVLIYDPVITNQRVQDLVVTVPFVDYWKGLFPFNDSFVSDIHNRHQSCGYNDFINKFLTYPPPSLQPATLPSVDKPECQTIFDDVFSAISLVNPCFDIYQVATTCPLLYDVLGFPGSMEYLPEGGQIYFNRTEVKKAIHANESTVWEECSTDDVFVGGEDSSLPSGWTVIPGIIERTQNFIISHGALDMVLIANGTLLGIQNMTWGGKLGFQSPPTEPFFVPYHDTVSLSTLAAQGVFGTTHTERGLTYVGVDIAGHMVPQYAPSAAYRQLEFLLGRVSSMSAKEPFTHNKNVTQPSGELGAGNAPAGFTTAGGSNSSGGGDGTRPTNAAGNVQFSAVSCLVALASFAWMLL